MKNKEKAAIVDALKDRYTLPMILRKLEMPKSSYYYQKARSDRIDKYQELLKSINAAYYDNRACYGYGRIHAVLKKNGVTVSEKIVRRLMREEGLFLRIKSRQKYSSYNVNFSKKLH